MRTIKNLKDEKKESIFLELIHDTVSNEKELTLRSVGRCMEPLVKTGDLISFSRVEINRLRHLDLVVFIDRITNNLLIHRFIASITNNGCTYIITKADAMRRFDSPTAEEDFIGRAAAIKKADRTIYLNTLSGKLRSYLNFLYAPLYLRFKRLISKQKKQYFPLENELLLLTSKINVNRDSKARIKKLLSNKLNWVYIFERIKWNFLAPYVYKHIINNCLKTKIPPEIRKQVEQSFFYYLSRDTRFYSELKDILSAFNKNGIRVVIIKGAHLAAEVYRDSSFRWMGDIDILAKIDDLPKLKTILVQLGFKLYGGDSDYWSLHYSDNHMTFFKENIKLEVKCNIWQMDFPSFKNDLWQRARSITLAAEKVLVPAIEDTLLIACVNLTRHSYAGIIWLCDIRKIITKFKKRIDWDVVIRRAQEKDITCMVYYALYYSSQLLGYEIPPDILKSLKPPLLKRRLHKFFWDEQIILWRKEGYPLRAKIAFEVAILLFAGKISFKPKKLLAMLIYITKIIIPNRSHLAMRCDIDKDSPKLIFCYLLQPLKFFLILLDSFLGVILGRKLRIVRYK